MTNQEILEQDPEFFDRADAHIHLSNSQIEGVDHGKVSASMMYPGGTLQCVCKLERV